MLRLPQPRQGGYTLIELMTVVLVIAILATIAYVSYSSYIKKAGRADARAALSTWAQSLERCYSQYYYYYNASPSASQPDCPAPAASGTNTLSPTGYYAITATRTASSYSLVATPVSGQPSANDSACTSFTVDNTGNKTATGSSPSICWGSN